MGNKAKQTEEILQMPCLWRKCKSCGCHICKSPRVVDSRGAQRVLIAFKVKLEGGIRGGKKEGGTVDPESDSAISAVFFIRVKGASHLSDQEAASRFLEYKIINVQIEYCTRIAAAQAD